jgi:hypothetical protein
MNLKPSASLWNYIQNFSKYLWSFEAPFAPYLPIVWLGPSPSPRPKTWFGPKENTKLSLHTHQPLLPPHKLFYQFQRTWEAQSQLVRAACVHCHGTKCPLLTAFLSLSFFFFCITYFSPRRGYRRVLKCCMGF